jgi:hypothetical protein
VESEGSRRQNAGPTNRNHIEADMLGEESIISKAQNLFGKHERRCGGHKREGNGALPGEVCSEKRAEVSRGHSKSRIGRERRPEHEAKGMTPGFRWSERCR